MKAIRRLVSVLALSLTLPFAAGAKETLPTWEGWIVGAPCAGELRIADCPLRYVDEPVLLLANGESRGFRFGDGSGVRIEEVDKAYSKRVRLTGELAAGVIQSVRLDLLEQSSERVFFKGCL